MVRILKFSLPLFLFIASCTKTEIEPDLTGNMAGHVFTFGEFSDNKMPADNSGVLVTAIGSKIYRTFSDKNGRFEFSKLPVGTYELQFAKDGYGTLKQFGIKHLGGEPTVLYNSSVFVLHKLPVTKVTEIKVEHDSIFCRFESSVSQPDHLYIQLYISRQQNFSAEAAELAYTNHLMYRRGEIYVSSLSYYSGIIYHQSLPYHSGEKILLKACASPLYGNWIVLYDFVNMEGIDTYFDYENNRIIYPALGKESAEFSYIIP